MHILSQLCQALRALLLFEPRQEVLQDYIDEIIKRSQIKNIVTVRNLDTVLGEDDGNMTLTDVNIFSFLFPLLDKLRVRGVRGEHEVDQLTRALVRYRYLFYRERRWKRVPGR